MASKRTSLGGYALLKTAVSTNDVREVIEKLELIGIEGGSHVTFRNSESDSVGNALAEGTSANFNAYQTLWAKKVWFRSGQNS
jgi:hypothetical protein